MLSGPFKRQSMLGFFFSSPRSSVEKSLMEKGKLDREDAEFVCVCAREKKKRT